MTQLPEPIKKVIEVLSRLPSIGPRQATRLAFHLINQGENAVRSLAYDIDKLKKIKICEHCFFIHMNSGRLCDICEDKSRNPSVIMIVEKETDLLSLENTGKFKGRYFVLGNISKTGLLTEWQKLRLQSLKSFIQKELAPSNSSGQGGQALQPGSGQALRSDSGQAEEIILAFNPTSVGDFNALLIIKELSPFAKKISRLGRGLPMGGEIEFADDETLGNALERRA